MALQLSTTSAVGHFLGLVEPFSAEDAYDLSEALDVAREQITEMVLPEAKLPDPVPASLHRACTVRAAEVFADRPERFGYQADADAGDGAGPPPARFIIRDLIKPWKRPAGGKGPDPRAQSFD